MRSIYSFFYITFCIVSIFCLANIAAADTRREVIDLDAHFTDINPIDSSGQVKDFELRFDLSAGEAVGPPCYRIQIPATAWIDWGDGYKIEVSDPKLLPAVIQVLKMENGQIIADLSNKLQSIDIKLRFHAKSKVWSLRLELAGILTPTMDFVPFFHSILGARESSLQFGGEQIASSIRKGEGEFTGDSLQMKYEYQIVKESQLAHEALELNAIFNDSAVIDSSGQPEAATLRFDSDPVGGVVPGILIAIAKTAWISDGAGGFQIEASDPSLLPAVIQVLKLENGQVVEDVTDHFESIDAKLNFLQNAKAWSLRLELAGIMTPTMDFAPFFESILGAGESSLLVDGKLLPAVIRQGKANFAGAHLDVSMAYGPLWLFP